MNIIKKYFAVIAIILPVLVLVLIRISGAGIFKPDLRKWAEPSVLGRNLITSEQAGSLSGNKLIISFDEGVHSISGLDSELCNIKPDALLNTANIDKIRKHNGPVLLYSSSGEVSARLWMVLSQTGRRELYIIATDTDEEVFKYKVRPDSLIRPEL
jgi:hypothetical protein